VIPDPGTPLNPDQDPQRYLGRDEDPDREHAATARVRPAHQPHYSLSEIQGLSLPREEESESTAYKKKEYFLIVRLIGTDYLCANPIRIKTKSGTTKYTMTCLIFLGRTIRRQMGLLIARRATLKVLYSEFQEFHLWIRIS
jgi:hypothetical protein